jgi:wobble nucleotide-excising tRNase
MLITRIQKIKQHRIFRDFSWPATGLPDFGRYNLIYGWNGVGKTTFSNLFRHLQDRSAIDDGEVTVVVDGDRVVNASQIPTATLPQIRVFNRDSIDRNIFEVEGKELPPVFYLGEDSIEIQKQIESLKKDQAEVAISAGSAQKELQTAQADLEKFCAEQARSIKNLLTVSGGGPYNNYNAASFRATSERLLKDITSVRLSETVRHRYMATKDGSPMPKIDRPIANYPDFVELTRRVNDVLARSIVSSVIDELRDAPAIAHWVAEGLNLHHGDHASKFCHFCKQPLPAGRMDQLEGHFNDAYSRFQAEIAALVNDVKEHKKLVAELQLPNKAFLYRNLREPFANAVEKCNAQSALVGTYLSNILSALEAKRNEPFRRLTLQSFFLKDTQNDAPVSGLITFFEVLISAGAGISAMIGKNSFDQACLLIDEHNKLSDNFTQELAESRRALESDAVSEALADFRSKLSHIAGIEKDLKEAVKNKKILDTQISELQKSIRHHHPAAEELTKDMHSYLGRDELRFEARDNGYLITRHNKPAMHLSEGERSAITFMYFLKSLQDTSFDLKNGVVVIDDPVSSLDANSLYCAFGFMKAKIQDAKQVFILTHNFTFFRQVKNWFNHIENFRGASLLDLKKVRFYMLKSEFSALGRSSSLRVLDNLLHRFESEYHHLFNVVLNASKDTLDISMERFYALPNTSRRLLEAVLAFKQPEKTGELYQQLKDISFDEAKKARIIRFTNTYSHHGLIAEPTHDLSVLAESPEIMKDVLELIKHLDNEHYENMKALCT